MKEAGEVVFVDASGGFDGDRYKIYLFMTHCNAGGNKTAHLHYFKHIIVNDVFKILNLLPFA